jgi:hypothetical protein
MRIIIRSREPETIEMTPDGRFVDPPARPIAAMVFRYAVLVGLVALGVGLAAVFAWLALMLIPVALVAGAIAWGAWRWQMWRTGKGFRR